MDARLATGAAAYAHGRAAELVQHERGVVASDLIAALPRALS
jgi:NAD(P)H-hydrate repair Nnr-like enzyme with NAD(P)H-hydrate dehydratase domain